MVYYVVKSRVICNGTKVQYIVLEDGTGEVGHIEEVLIKNIRVYELEKEDGRAIYLVIDKETGEILYDKDGKGSKTKELAVVGYIQKEYERLKDIAERNKRVREWMDRHKTYVRFIKSIVEVSGADEYYIKEFMRSNGIEVDFDISDLFRVLGVKEKRGV